MGAWQKFITKDILKRLPPLYANEEKDPSEVKVIAKWFNPTGAGTWFATEYDPEERIFFGYVTLGDDDCAELGYFSRDELESYRGRFGLGIERDQWFKGATLQEVMDKKGRL